MLTDLIKVQELIAEAITTASKHPLGVSKTDLTLLTQILGRIQNKTKLIKSVTDPVQG